MTGNGLCGIGVAVTRALEDAGQLTALLRKKGAHVETWPCIGYEDPADPESLRSAVRRLDSFDWIATTSPRAAARLVAAAGGLPSGVRLAAGGPVTASVLAVAGWPAHRVATMPGARGLVDAFALAGDAAGADVLFACGDRALATVPAGLSELGARVERVVVYRTLELAPEPELMRTAAESGNVRVVTFTSPSAVSGFLAGAETAGVDAAASFTAAALGPTTAAAVEATGWGCLTATEATLDGLVEAVERAAESNFTTGRWIG